MSICFCNRTADLALRELRRNGQKLNLSSSPLLTDCTPEFAEAAGLANELGLNSSDHFELLVGLQEHRRSTGKLVTHLWSGKLPEGSFYSLGEGAYLPTPCFCLLQQARELHLIKLCQMLGYYLGTEQIQVTHDGITTDIELPPLVTEEELALYLKDAEGIKGCKALRKALQYTCANAASPQETNLQLMLTLPLSYYGFGLKPPIMNYRFDLDEPAQRLYPHQTCRIDLFWHELDGGLEFQGKEHGKTLGEDYARFLALQSQGKNVLYAAIEQLQSPAQMQYLAKYVAKATRVNINGPSWPLESDTQRLIDIIFDRVRPGKNERRPVRRRRR